MKHMRKIYYFSLFCFAMAMVQGCGREVFYSDEYDANERGWNKDDKAQFSVAVEDTLGLYNFFIDVRNSKKYAYSNFFLFINTTFPDGSVAHDTLECPLADDEGHWLGRKTGCYVDNRYYLRKHVIFPMSGTYRFEIGHGMRDTNVTGIKSVGLHIERLPLNR